MWLLVDDLMMLVGIAVLCATFLLFVWMLLSHRRKHRKSDIDVVALAKSIENLPLADPTMKVRVLKAVLDEIEPSAIPVRTKEIEVSDANR